MSHFPLTLSDEETASITIPLLESGLRGLYRSLNLATDNSENQLESIFSSPISDQGSSIDCLTGFLELSRYLIDVVARTNPDLEVSGSSLLDFLLFRVVYALLNFALRWVGDGGTSSKRWVKKEEFFLALFDQVRLLFVY